MILIGSKAIKHWFPDFPREPKDTDYAVNKILYPYNKTKDIEYLVNEVLWEYYDEPYGKNIICDVDELYTLKMSHVIGWKLENGSWDKHLWDIQWLKNRGCMLNRPLFDKLYKYWETVHGPNKRSDLNMSAEEFFDNAIEFPIKHDEIHEILIKHPFFKNQEKPTYNKILIGEVDVSMEKFLQLTEEEKYNVVVEEVMVMAMERWSKIGYLHAFHRMLKKFVREHAKIEEAIWILENWQKLHKAPFNFIEHIKKEIIYEPI